jgi:Carbohydrate esterase, sialic acid-specific acetylesterase
MVQRAKVAAEIGDGGEIKAVLWYQGESDTESDQAAEVYSDNLKKFIEDVRSDLALPYLPFIQVREFVTLTYVCQSVASSEEHRAAT